MGVLSLLKHLQPCLADSHVEAYRGKTVAMDGNTFIFRGCYSCSEQVATGQPCSGPVNYLLKRVRMLKHYGVKPWVVLDGRRTPMKDDTNNQRRHDREKNLRQAKDLQRQAGESSGAERDALLQKAQTFFQKSIHVTRQMVTNAMAALKKEGVACMVAPYEADAQVAFLATCGLASAVITEDSDILVYMAAAKCTASVLYKMDEFGNCKEMGFDAAKLSSLPGVIGKFCRGLSAFVGEGGGRLFVQLAALAGCDYVDNVRGLGLLSALPIISRFSGAPADHRVKRILMHLQKMGKTVPEGHRERMLRAELSFFWHRVYDPRSKTCVHFCNASPELIGTAEVPALPNTAGGMDFLGEHIENDLVVRISKGEVDPRTGDTVTADPIPAPTYGARRTKSQPSPSVSRGPAVTTAPRTKSSPMPMKTPRGAWQQQRQGGAPGNGGGGAFIRHHRQPPQGPRGGEKEVSRNQGGGQLKDMFERAKFKSEDKENNPVGTRGQGVQDISEIVLACAPVRTPSRSRPESAHASTPAPILNPFAGKAVASATTAAYPSDFITPAAAGIGTRSRSDVPRADHEYAGAGADAWSRLSKGCLAGARVGEETAVIALGVVTEKKREEGEGAVTIAREGLAFECSVPDVEPSAKLVVKRTLLPAVEPGGKGGGRRKKAKVGGRKLQPPSAGQGKTILSFFGRAVMSKP